MQQVAGTLISNGKLEDGIQLLILIGKAADACRYLQVSSFSYFPIYPQRVNCIRLLQRKRVQTGGWKLRGLPKYLLEIVQSAEKC